MKDTLAEFVNVHVMEKESIVIDDTIFICATLWTDMNNHNSLTINLAAGCMNDYNQVRHGTNAEPWKVKLKPIDTIADHVNAKHYIFNEIEKHKDKKVVVVSHHLPSYQSVPKQFQGDDLNGAYASELFEDIIKTKPNLWIHGHTHASMDYKLADTRVVCNPRGYDTYGGGDLNMDFNEELLLDV